MPIDYAQLKTEIQTDPATLGYASKGDQDIADLLNAPTAPSFDRDSMTAAKFYGELAVLSVPFKLKAVLDTAANVTVGQQSITIAETKQTLEDLKYMENVTPSDTFYKRWLSALVQFTVLTGGQRAVLVGRVASRAELLFGARTNITNSDVSFALRGQR